MHAGLNVGREVELLDWAKKNDQEARKNHGESVRERKRTVACEWRNRFAGKGGGIIMRMRM